MKDVPGVQAVAVTLTADREAGSAPTGGNGAGGRTQPPTGSPVARGAAQAARHRAGAIPGVANIIAVASGKGGVGKSTTAVEPLDLDDLEMLALAAYLSGLDQKSTLAWTRAHHEAIRRNDPQRAAREAVLIASGLMFRGETAPAMGWFARGGRVLEGCGACAEHAWLVIWNAFAQMWGGDPEGALPAFADSVGFCQRFDDSDLLTMSRLGQGMCLVLAGPGPRRPGPVGRGYGRGHGW